MDIPMEKIISLNDAIEDENSMIRVGQEIIITNPEPPLSINRVEQEYIEEDYDAEVQYIENDEWYTTDRVTRQEPSAGHRNIVAQINYLNDKEISREVIKEEVLLEAIPKIVERGTKIPPTYIKPVSGGRLSSTFGRRNAPTRGASSNHQGVDWAIAKGSTVMASSGGKVTKAGWAKGYGYVVYIQHPDGKETRYGHLSKVLVSVGQTVRQGDKIALSGNSGVSTGPHLHFEIRVNGTAVNPLKYLN
jgi:murein DD-endopeptidase MepM/ murein hydrolase activator NlpD